MATRTNRTVDSYANVLVHFRWTRSLEDGGRPNTLGMRAAPAFFAMRQASWGSVSNASPSASKWNFARPAARNRLWSKLLWWKARGAFVRRTSGCRASASKTRSESVWSMTRGARSPSATPGHAVAAPSQT